MEANKQTALIAAISAIVGAGGGTVGSMGLTDYRIDQALKECELARTNEKSILILNDDYEEALELLKETNAKFDESNQNFVSLIDLIRTNNSTDR